MRRKIGGKTRTLDDPTIQKRVVDSNTSIKHLDGLTVAGTPNGVQAWHTNNWAGGAKVRFLELVFYNDSELAALRHCSQLIPLKFKGH